MATTTDLEPRKRAPRKARALPELADGSTPLPVAVPITQATMLASGTHGEAGWRYILRNMQPMVMALAFCLTAVICVWITSSRTPATAGPRYQTIDFDDEDGKTLLKFDRESGRAWRLAKMRIPVRARKADGSSGPQLVAGWEEISPSFEQGVQETWHRMGAPTPAP
ncbi:MAG: hypothetical protein JO354_06055 [Verrucomicrobia bacterium]|nr:hypothetical protein [Verrucomicrobiota bacterium]